MKQFLMATTLITWSQATSTINMATIATITPH
jgi:hypothetical protein